MEVAPNNPTARGDGSALCGLCGLQPARSSTKNPYRGKVVGRRLCYRCGERRRDFSIRIKALEVLLLGPYTPAAEGGRRPTAESRTLRGLLLLYGGWLCSFPSGPGTFSLSEFPGMFARIGQHHQARRPVEALVKGGELCPLEAVEAGGRLYCPGPAAAQGLRAILATVGELPGGAQHLLGQRLPEIERLL